MLEVNRQISSVSQPITSGGVNLSQTSRPGCSISCGRRRRETYRTSAWQDRQMNCMRNSVLDRKTDQIPRRSA